MIIQNNSKKRPQFNFSLTITLVSIAFLLMLARTFTPHEGRLTITIPQAQVLVPQVQKPRSQSHPQTLKIHTVPSYDAHTLKLTLSESPFNPTLGRAHAPKQVYVLGHVGCKSCYKILKSLKKVTLNNPTQVRLVAKFAAPLPLKNSSTEAGLFTFLAQDERAFWSILEHLPSPTQNNALTYLNAFEKAGYSLKEVRQKLGLHTQTYMRQLENDLETFKAIQHLPLPIVVINNKVLPAATVQDVLSTLQSK